MRKLHRGLLLLLSAAALSGCPKGAPKDAPGTPVREPRWKLEDFGGVLSVGLEGYRDFEQGERLFGQSSCGTCHAFGRYVNPSQTGPSLNRKALQYTPEEALSHILNGSWHRAGSQPILENLEQAQILDLLAYLLSGARPDSPFFSKSN